MKGNRPQSDRCWVPFQPTVDVPAYAVIVATGATLVNGQVIYTTRRYAADDKGTLLLVNGPTDVATGKIGFGATAEGYQMPALGETSTGAPSAGDTCGPTADSWTLSTDGTGYVCWGSGAVAGTVMVSRASSTGELLWGKVQSGFSNGPGNTTYTVSIKSCEYDGTGVTGEAFNAYTPLRANHDTALFTDYVVQYGLSNTKYIITSDIWDAPINTIRAVASDDAIRDGWEELTNTRDRVIRGLGSGGTYGTVGGSNTHVHDAHTNNEDCISGNVSGATIILTGPTAHNTAEHWPPYVEYKYIKRTS